MRLEHELTPIVRKWLKGTKRSPYTAQQSVSKVMRSLSQTPQRRHRRWSPPWRKPSRTTSPEVAQRDIHPAPIPAVNGHAPTVIGRTQTMFSPVTAIAAGALVIALGGAVLIAQPFDQQGGVPGAATEVAPPVEFTAVMADGPCWGDVPSNEGMKPDTQEWVGDVAQVRGGICRIWWEASEPMLEGMATISYNSNLYPDESRREPVLEVATTASSIVNEHGAWRERPRVDAETTDYESYSSALVMDGEGAYEGLTVVAVTEHRGLESDSFKSVDGYPTSNVWDVRGFIIDGGLPPAGENASTK